ncbi:unnamed protein product [Rotaria sp. Silwood1]|nr:unnamed protein product [Rotaria sp. Silwood1]
MAFSMKPSTRPDPSIGTLFSLYDENFTWTEQHIPPSELNQWRKEGDLLIDEFYNSYGKELDNGMDMYNFI